MPEMDGRELIAKIRGDDTFQKLPIIIMSAVIGVNEVAKLLDLGADFFIGKPLKSSQMMEYVEKCLRK
jgi:DNA-binding response OmpR family regulator